MIFWCIQRLLSSQCNAIILQRLVWTKNKGLPKTVINICACSIAHIINQILQDKQLNSSVESIMEGERKEYNQPVQLPYCPKQAHYHLVLAAILPQISPLSSCISCHIAPNKPTIILFELPYPPEQARYHLVLAAISPWTSPLSSCFSCHIALTSPLSFCFSCHIALNKPTIILF